MARRNNAAMAQLGLAVIALPFNLILSFMKHLDQAEKDRSMMERRQVLNQNTYNLMESRNIMAEKRKLDIERAAIQVENERLRGELLATQAELNRVRTEQMKNLKFNPIDQDTPTDNVWNTCEDCGCNQALSFGDNCAICGGTNLKRIRLPM